MAVIFSWTVFLGQRLFQANERCYIVIHRYPPSFVLLDLNGDEQCMMVVVKKGIWDVAELSFLWYTVG